MVKIDFEKLKSEYNETQKGFSLFKRKTPSYCPSGFYEVTKLTEFEIYNPESVDKLSEKCGENLSSHNGLSFFKGVGAVDDGGNPICVALAYEYKDKFCLVRFIEKDENANLIGYVAQMIGNLCLNKEKLPVVRTKDKKIIDIITSVGYEKTT